jgi:plastocyanin
VNWLALVLAAAIGAVAYHPAAPKKHHRVTPSTRLARKPPAHKGILRKRPGLATPLPSGSPVAQPGQSSPPGTSAPTATPTPVYPSRTGVDLNDRDDVLSLTPVYRILKAGTISFLPHNVGMDDHNLSIQNDAGATIASVDVPANDDENPDPPEIDIDLAPGSYTLYCNVANHRQLGMVATITVR